MNDFLTCDRCGVQSEDVQTCIDPYDQEINDKEVEVTLCHNCYQERIWDI
jgi:hypothetical protein